MQPVPTTQVSTQEFSILAPFLSIHAKGVPSHASSVPLCHFHFGIETQLLVLASCSVSASNSPIICLGYAHLLVPNSETLSVYICSLNI